MSIESPCSGRSWDQYFQRMYSRCEEGGCFPLVGPPNGIRTRVADLKSPCPRPLDDGGAILRLDREILTSRTRIVYPHGGPPAHLGRPKPCHENQVGHRPGLFAREADEGTLGLFA